MGFSWLLPPGCSALCCPPEEVHCRVQQVLRNYAMGTGAVLKVSPMEFLPHQTLCLVPPQNSQVTACASWGNGWITTCAATGGVLPCFRDHVVLRRMPQLSEMKSINALNLEPGATVSAQLALLGPFNLCPIHGLDLTIQEKLFSILDSESLAKMIPRFESVQPPGLFTQNRQDTRV